MGPIRRVGSGVSLRPENFLGVGRHRPNAFLRRERGAGALFNGRRNRGLHE